LATQARITLVVAPAGAVVNESAITETNAARASSRILVFTINAFE
jgi:hypothetical protein